MQVPHLKKAALLAVSILVIFIASWELYLRSQGLSVDYDDGESLWADKRAKVYMPADQATVFIGSSRIKYDLDIETWKSLTNIEPVQLSIEGNSPLPVLHDLADDENFKGNLVIDVTEGLFFSTHPGSHSEPKRNIAYYHKRSPTQQFSFGVNKILESKLVLLDKYNFSLNGMLDKLRIPNRAPVFTMPIFPLDFGRTTFDRQAVMTEKFVKDTSLQNEVIGIWNFFSSIDKDPPVAGKALDSMLLAIKSSCNKIKSRGGKIIFVRTPSSGGFWQGEQMGFPREKYWERLLKETKSPGIHFADYPAIANFKCPELSHLTKQDAIIFTQHFVKIIGEKGWFGGSNAKAEVKN
jgi:hypothetical protein